MIQNQDVDKHGCGMNLNKSEFLPLAVVFLMSLLCVLAGCQNKQTTQAGEPFKEVRELQCPEQTRRVEVTNTS